MPIQISVIICTYNRSNYLKKSLNSLINQTLNENDYEILVIDNASTDDSKEIVENFSSIKNLKYIVEPILGVSQARNTGINNSKGEYVAFIDDDAIASPQWLEKILEIFRTFTPSPGCIGGKIDLIFEAPKPKWLSDEMSSYLSKLDLSGQSLVLNNKDLFLYSCNFALPKNVLDEIGGFNITIGRKGDSLVSGGDILVQKEVQKKGYLCLYHPEIYIQHYVIPSRLTKTWFIERIKCEGITNAKVEILSKNLSTLKCICMAFYEAIKLILSLRLLSLIIETDNASFFTHKCIAMRKISYISYLLRYK
jgi:glycosyltransferase involved in cell wall biosynthesis